jgi:hypothetical protein
MMSKAVVVEELGGTFLKVEYEGGFASGKIKLHDINKDLELIINAIGVYKEKNKGPVEQGSPFEC